MFNLEKILFIFSYSTTKLHLSLDFFFLFFFLFCGGGDLSLDLTIKTDDAEMFTSEMHDPYTRITVA